MTTNFYFFSETNEPHTAVGVLPPDVLEDGPGRGVGILISHFPVPGYKYGEKIREEDCDKMIPIEGLWFFREESIDSVILRLEKAKNILRREKEVDDEGV